MRAGAPSTAVKAPRTFAPRSARGRPACRRLVAAVRARSDATGSCQRTPSASARRAAGTWPRSLPRSRSPGHGDERVDRRPRHDVCNERPRAPARGRAARAPSRPTRSAAHARRRPARPWHGRTRGGGPCTRRSVGPATPPGSRSARRRAAQSGRGRRGTARTAAAPAPRSRRSVGAGRARGGPSTDATAEAVTRTCHASCRLRVAQSSTEAASISRSAGRARSRSSGSLIGKNRPRAPERGTSRNVVSSTHAIWW